MSLGYARGATLILKSKKATGGQLEMWVVVIQSLGDLIHAHTYTPRLREVGVTLLTISLNSSH